MLRFRSTSRPNRKKRKPSERNPKVHSDGSLFHVKQCPKSLDILHLREDRQSDPDIQKRDNAECATESPPQGRRIYPAHVSAARTETARGCLHVSLVMSESAEARGDRPVFQLQVRASPKFQRSAPTQNPKFPHSTPPDADDPSFTPHSPPSRNGFLTEFQSPVHFLRGKLTSFPLTPSPAFGIIYNVDKKSAKFFGRAAKNH